MDDFTPYGETFDQDLTNLGEVLQRFIEMNIFLRNEKYLMLTKQGIVLGHHISSKGIEVDPTKVKIIVDLPSPPQKKDVRSFLGHVGYYHRFIKYFRKISPPMFLFLTKDAKNPLKQSNIKL